MSLTFHQLAAKFLAWAEQSLTPATVDYYRRQFEGFAAVAGDQVAANIKRHALVAWGRTWHQIQAVQRLFAWAVEDAELLERNQFRSIKRPPIGQRRRVLDGPTLARLLRRARTTFRWFLLAMRETLARPQEVRALRWEWLDWPGKPYGLVEALHAGKAVFVLHEYKSRRQRLDPTSPRVILVSPRLGRLLARLVAAAGSLAGHVFTNDRGLPWTKNAVRLRMRTLRRALHLDADHRGERIVAYTIRHTQATRACAAGLRDRLLADIMGHTSTRTTARYQHLDVRHLQDAMELIRRVRSREYFGDASPRAADLDSHRRRG